MSILIWIDKNVENDENKNYIKELSNLNEFIIYTYKDVKSGIKKLKQIKFKNTFVISSGSLYKEFIKEFKKEENLINTIPKILIFTRDRNKFLKSSKDIEKEFINDPFYNFGGIKTVFSEIKDFLLNKIPKKIRELEEDNLIFEYIDDIKKLYLPLYYKTLIKITPLDDFDKFNQFILSKYSNSKQILKLFLQLNSMKKIPIKLLSKYYARAYTAESNLYKDMNSELQKGNIEKYNLFIKMMYEGNKLGALPIYNENTNLFRGGQLSNKEIQILKDYLKKKIKGLPASIVFSKSFLSFSKDENKAKEFIKKTNQNFTPVFFVLENNKNLNQNLFTNSDIENISFYQNEREVLFFPFSSFEINKIQEVQINGIKITQINLNYLGKYEKQLKQEKNIEQIIPKSSFQNLIVQTGIIKNINYTPKIIFENEDKYIKEVNTNNNLEKSINEIICEYDIK